MKKFLLNSCTVFCHDDEISVNCENDEDAPYFDEDANDYND